ncbi:MAG: hypothetical protein IKD10_13535 [Lentisphaeria bacterium]|nr:hypothetical protein [Lentisphaeria bacterium]
MVEFYRDEHPKNKESWWGNPPMPTGGIGGGWVDGGDVGGGGGELDGGEGEKWFLLGLWQMDFPLLLTDSAGRLLSDANDVLLYSAGGCLTLNIECQIMGDTAGYHVSCLIAGVDAIESSHPGGMLKDLLLNGALSVKVKWQAGHYDIGTVHTARFRINESEPTPWIVIPLAENPCEVMQIEIVDGQIRPVRAIKR